MNRHVLLIDEDENAFVQLSQSLCSHPIVLSAEREPHKALSRLRSQPLDAALIAVDGASSDGLALLEMVHSLAPQIPLIAVTASATVDLTVRAFRLGATDLLTKPLCCADVLSALKRTLSPGLPDRFGREATGEEPWHKPAEMASPVFSGSVMNDVRNRAIQFANSDSPILARGELGVGKELLLKWIHCLSGRNRSPFVKVYCDAIHESQFTEMLFGVDSGELDSTQRRGYLEQAGQGTIVFHNVSALSEASQTALADAFNSRTYRPVNSDKVRPFRARLTATIVDRPQMASDLVVLEPRLRAIFGGSEMYIPPLRARVEHLRPLVHAINFETGSDPTLQSRWSNVVISEPGLAALESHYWPGNVDELWNFIRRLFVFAERPHIDEKEVADLLVCGPRWRGAGSRSARITGDNRMISRAIVAEAIQRAQGNKSAAARSLGLHRKTLYRIIEGAMKQEDHKNCN